ncbi:MAG: serine/threonine-protein kinase [Thermoanaerobaculia bacterium]|nr:serine/threonine-protein kinase [Thermoanaerobaculia bacterium]
MTRPADLEDLPTLFAQAAELDSAARAEFLGSLAARSPELARELDSLLAAADREAPWLSTSAWRPRDPGPATEPPTSIGPYRVLAELGRGGVGRVLLAEETGEGFVRRVAVKVLMGSLADRETLERFRTEGHLLAGLEHPGIARLYDTGTTAEGLPYLVMEYIDGADLTTYATTRGLGTRARVELFLQVLEAVQFAHRHLIVHRDLKPANLLVDAAGRVKLLDFGIAKLVADSEGADTSAATRLGRRWLTPAYASPEQIAGKPTTTAADIYSLGVVLYELLAGQRPHNATGAELEAAILARDPPIPSSALRSTQSAVSARELEGDLDAIVSFALRKEPEARYRSAEAFAEDLRRHLEGFPVVARQGTRWYRWGKFVRRNGGSLSAAALVFLALSGGLGAALWQAREAAEARAVAERRLADVQGLASAMIFEVAAAIEPLDGSGPVMELTIDRALEYLDRIRADGNMDGLEELAAGYERVGAIASTWPIFGRGTGRREKGRAALERALELRRQLAARPNSSPVDRLRLSRLMIRRCDFERAGGDPRRAEEVCSEAIGILEPLVAESPESPEYRLELAVALTQKLFVRAALRGSESVREGDDFERAVTLWRELGESPTEAISWRHDYPWGLAITSTWLADAGRLDLALSLARQAVAATTTHPLTKKLPAGGIRILDRVRVLEVLGRVEWDAGMRREALEHFEQSRALDLAHQRQDNRRMVLIGLFNRNGQICRLAGELGDVRRGEQALVEGAALIAEGAAWWKPETVTWTRGLLERDRGLMYHAASKYPKLPAGLRAAHRERAVKAYERAIEILESLRQNGQDPFGVAEAVALCQEGLDELR